MCLEEFKGDAGWIHAFEGHAGKPYWPGGNSGITLDPGLDLGHASPKLFEKYYVPLMNDEQRKEAEDSIGVKGRHAKELLDHSSALKTFRISRKEAEKIFPHLLDRYWRQLLNRWPELLSAPPEVQTALLSLAYNRGPNNRRLSILGGPISRADWRSVGEMIKNMQQNHPLKGIRERRRKEGELILSIFENG